MCFHLFLLCFILRTVKDQLTNKTTPKLCKEQLQSKGCRQLFCLSSSCQATSIETPGEQNFLIPALNYLPRGESAACGQSRGAGQTNRQHTVRHSHMQSVPNGLCSPCSRGQRWEYWHEPPAVTENLRSRQLLGKWPYETHAKYL